MSQRGKHLSFRILIACLVLISVLSRLAQAEPCSVLRLDNLPCDIQQGQEASYSGTLMTNSTAFDLVSKVFKIKQLDLDIAYERQVHDIDNKINEKLIYQLKVNLADAPLPFFESPWFWLGVAGAFGGGLALGLSLK